MELARVADDGPGDDVPAPARARQAHLGGAPGVPGRAGFGGGRHLDGHAQGAGRGSHDLDGVRPGPRPRRAAHPGALALPGQDGAHVGRLGGDARLEGGDLLLAGPAVDAGDGGGDGARREGHGADLVDGDVVQTARDIAPGGFHEGVGYGCAQARRMQAALGNCAMGEGDNVDVHFADTVKGSDWGCDQEVARLFADAAPIEMRRLAHWGVPWNRVVPGSSFYFKGGEKFEKFEKPEKEGLITARSFGGTAKWRTCYTSDGTGHAVMCTMDNKCAQLGINVLDRKEAISLIHDGEKCMGAVVRCLRTGVLEIFLAKATVSLWERRREPRFGRSDLPEAAGQRK